MKIGRLGKKTVIIISMIMLLVFSFGFYSCVLFEPKEVKEGRILMEQISQVAYKKFAQLADKLYLSDKLKEKLNLLHNKHKMRNECQINFAKNNFNKIDWKYFLAYLKMQAKYKYDDLSEVDSILDDIKGMSKDVSSFKGNLLDLSIMNDEAALFLVKFKKMNLLCNYE